MDNQTENTPRNNGTDNRYLPRWEVTNRTQYQLEHGEKVHEAQSKDLSCSGMSLVVSEAIPLNQKVKLKIYLSGNTSVEADGEIVWCRPTVKGNVVGIDFREISENMKQLILNYAFEVKRDDLIKHWFGGWK